MGEFNFDELDNMIEPVDKEKNKQKMLEALNKAFDNGTPFIDYCDQYVYAIIPNQGYTEWKEYSYIREDGELQKNVRDSEMAFLVIKEEVVRGLPEVVPDLNVTTVNELASKHEKDPKGFIEALIAELPNLPIVKNKDELNKAISLVETS
ncbi:MAG: hypothetical protein ACTSVI_17090 [Promethearchaeota archaeon]